MMVNGKGPRNSLLLRIKDGSGAGSGSIPADFGFADFGFGF